MLMNTQKVMLSQMILSLCRVMKWMSPAIVKHQMRVAYIALNIAREIGLCKEAQNQLLIASVLHDIGALALREHVQPSGYDTDFGTIPAHAELGYQLLKKFPPFERVANLIRHHHLAWEDGTGLTSDRDIPTDSQIIFLAGTIEASVREGREILGQVPEITARIQENAGALFAPEYVAAFQKLAVREYFWFNIESALVKDVVIEHLRQITTEVDFEDLISLSKVFSHLIDFQCTFTATHSSGVAGTAEALARRYSFSESGCRMIKVAGYLHDIGKLIIPPEILNKPGQLSQEEFNIIKKHPFWTYQALNNIVGLEEVNMWASFHHERKDSCGYPFRYKGEELPLGSRLVAVADVFTALTEDRPYRQGMVSTEVLALLEEMVNSGVLDSGVVSVLKNNYREVDEARQSEQDESVKLYQEFHALKQNSLLNHRVAHTPKTGAVVLDNVTYMYA